VRAEARAGAGSRYRARGAGARDGVRAGRLYGQLRDALRPNIRLGVVALPLELLLKSRRSFTRVLYYLRVQSSSAIT
jgi:hypothetical protein